MSQVQIGEDASLELVLTGSSYENVIVNGGVVKHSLAYTPCLLVLLFLKIAFMLLVYH